MMIENIIAEVRRLAEEFPDNVYVSDNGPYCYYDDGRCTNGSIGCIFGQAIRNLGLDWDLSDNVGILKVFIRNGIPMYRGHLWCRVLQVCQDNGSTWKQAVTRADEEVCVGN